MNDPQDRKMMNCVLELAHSALEKGEFPVAAVVGCKGEIIAQGVRKGSSGEIAGETDHAEILALRNLEEKKPQAEREEMTLYCNLEPCLMCFGAVILSRIRRIVYAYEDVMGGGTGCRVGCLSPLYRNTRLKIIPNVLRAESLVLFKKFFQNPENVYWKGSLLAEYTLSAG